MYATGLKGPGEDNGRFTKRNMNRFFALDGCVAGTLVMASHHNHHYHSSSKIPILFQSKNLLSLQPESKCLSKPTYENRERSTMRSLFKAAIFLQRQQQSPELPYCPMQKSVSHLLPLKYSCPRFYFQGHNSFPSTPHLSLLKRHLPSLVCLPLLV